MGDDQKFLPPYSMDLYLSANTVLALFDPMATNLGGQIELLASIKGKRETIQYG